MPKKKTSMVTAQTRQLDKLAGSACRNYGICQATEWPEYPGTYKGALSWCHIKSRRYRVLRWDPLNCLCMSNAAHMWTHANPDEFARMIEHIRPGTTDYLMFIMRSIDKPDMAAWLAYYRDQRPHPYEDIASSYGLNTEWYRCEN